MSATFNKIISILLPILYGFIMTFLFSPIYNKVYKVSGTSLAKISNNTGFNNSLSRVIATIACVLLMLSIITALIWMLIPQLFKSVEDMIAAYPKNSQKFYIILDKLLTDNSDIAGTVLSYYNQWSKSIEEFIKRTLLPNLSDYIKVFSSGIYSFVREIFNFLVGVMVMVYLLNIKTKLIAQMKKILYAFCPVEFVNGLIEEAIYVKTSFSQFIVGKIIDSIIIGILNYIAMLILSMPYALVISVIVGITNVIPFFGPFLGAIPSAFILLLVSPVQCLKFLVWILILQQLDGNVIGPRVLGQTTGLPSFWILFSILLFGGLFGVVGMIIAVPTWAVIYRWVSRYTNIYLEKKKLSVKTDDYINLKRIDEESGKYEN
ncbi:MAG: AI-2E family transporter [Lachnospiraceae bacterium]|nr:MAG: AI-2E family transporter [Lachnospiraceae bacterium]